MARSLLSAVNGLSATGSNGAGGGEKQAQILTRRSEVLNKSVKFEILYDASRLQVLVLEVTCFAVAKLVLNDRLRNMTAYGVEGVTCMSSPRRELRHPPMKNTDNQVLLNYPYVHCRALVHAR